MKEEEMVRPGSAETSGARVSTFAPRGWRSMDTAPRDQTVKIRTAGGYIFNAARNAYVEGENGEVLAWAAGAEDDHPLCWSDGICWAVNAEMQPSDPPIGWRPLRALPNTPAADAAEGAPLPDVATAPGETND